MIIIITRPTVLHCQAPYTRLQVLGLGYRNIGHTGLEALPSKKNGPLMGQVILDLSDPGGGGMGWQNLRKWEKS